jgi:hypothetical protein
MRTPNFAKRGSFGASGCSLDCCEFWLPTPCARLAADVAVDEAAVGRAAPASGVAAAAAARAMIPKTIATDNDGRSYLFQVE